MITLQDLQLEHTDSLTLPGLSLEVAADGDLRQKTAGLTALVEQAWPVFQAMADAEGLWDILGLDPSRHTLEIELNWVDMQTMQTLNRETRGKDSATDVLTFTLLADHPDPTPWLQLPVVQLGSIFVCLDWAEAEIRKDPSLNLSRYILERVIHGLLHLLGLHHDTMEQFERVVRLQNKVLDSALTQPPRTR